MELRFTPLTRRADVGLRGLSTTRAGVVWASGTGGHFALTRDGGQTWLWSRVAGRESLDFRSVAALGEGVAVMANAGPPATILKTSDWGESWKVVFKDGFGAMFLDALAFRDGASGVCLGDPIDGRACLLATEDGGDTWSLLPAESLPAMASGEAHFAASGTCLAAVGKDSSCFVSGGAAAKFYRSDDNGANWLVRDLPLMSGEAPRGAFSVITWGQGKACVVGGDYARPELNVDTSAWSDDGGLTWNRASAFPQGGYCSCVARAVGHWGDALVAVGPRGSHLSVDGGVTWSSVDPEPYNSVAFSDGVGWAAGTDGRISRIRIE